MKYSKTKSSKMEETKMKKMKKVLGWGAAAVVAAGLLGGGIGFALQPEPQVVKVVEEVEVEVLKEVEVPVEVEVEKIVEVEDNAFLKIACDRLVYEDLEDCKEEVLAEDEALALAWAELEAEGFDMLEDKNLFKDEDDLEFVKFYDDFEDVKVLKSDFDDEEYKFKLVAKVEDFKRDIKKKVEFLVHVEDGDAELKNVKLY